jgi:sialidase-1
MKSWLIILLIALLSSVIYQEVKAQAYVPVFPLNSEGYSCYRIPAIISMKGGDLLAFAEGRKNNCSDFGNVDIVMKRSHDSGESWSPLTVIIDNDSLQAGNISPVVDNLDPRFPDGRVFVFYNTGNAMEGEIRAGKGVREVWYIATGDAGEHWSQPVNITRQVHYPNQPTVNQEYNFTEDWRGYANGPGHAMQITKRKYNGRIIVPANHTEGEPWKDWSDSFAHAFYSDDHGMSFHRSANVNIPGSNEATAAMLSDGSVMINARNQKGDPGLRVVAVSHDGATTWDTAYYDHQLIDPICQGSLLNVKYRGKHMLIFSNPASHANRQKLTLKVSFNNGRTWPKSFLAVEGDAAYSDIVGTGKKKIGVIFEKGSDGGIYFLSVPLREIVKRQSEK